MPSLTTLQKVRRQRGVGEDTSEDQNLADLIVASSASVERICGYTFGAVRDTKGFNGEVGAINPILDLDDWPLLEIVTLKNGNDETLTTAQFTALPRYGYPKRQVRLAQGVYWIAPGYPPGSSSVPPTMPLLDVAYAVDAISIDGIWGWHQDYGHAWKRVSVTVGTGGIDDTVTTLPITGANLDYDVFPKIDVGDVIKITTGTAYEFLRVVGPVANTVAAASLTVERGYNGSTAIAHIETDVIDVWVPDPVIELAVRETVVASFGAQQNAAGEMLTAPSGYVMTTVDVPKRVVDKLRWPYFSPVRGMKP